AVGAALTVALRRDRVAPPANTAARRDSVALSGARPAVAGTTTNTAAAKTPGGSPGSTTETSRPPSTVRPSTTTVPRAPTTVAGRARTDTGSERPSVERRRPAIPPEFSPAMVPIRNFAAAVESGDVQRIKQAYPGLTASQQARWETVFKQSKVRARIQSARGMTLNQATGQAVVQFVMALTFTDKITGSETAGRPATYQATMKREGSNLVLVSLDDVTPRR
ncbi:MAG: hypothetical protein M3303_12280, partial [Gemmatimonadota bacterium]|nr:hypothetical protein [Gemmatimonadota bacterium]